VSAAHHPGESGKRSRSGTAGMLHRARDDDVGLVQLKLQAQHIVEEVAGDLRRRPAAFATALDVDGDRVASFSLRIEYQP